MRKINYIVPVKPNDHKYWMHLAAFAYSSFLDYGDGVVEIKEWHDQPFSPAELEKHFKYIPCDFETDNMPIEATGMIVDYDPKKEVVLVITDAKKQSLCLKLTAEKLGCTPLEAYKALHGKFVPGQIYQLHKPIDGVQPGNYVFEKEEKAMLIFCRMGMDDDEGDACRTKEVIKVHQDFRDYFVGTEMKVRVE